MNHHIFFFLNFSNPQFKTTIYLVTDNFRVMLTLESMLKTC